VVQTQLNLWTKRMASTKSWISHGGIFFLVLCINDRHTAVSFFFFVCFAATQLARQVHQERTQVLCSNKVARKRLARRHSRNGPWTRKCCFEVDVLFVCLFVCWNKTRTTILRLLCWEGSKPPGSDHTRAVFVSNPISV